jgi:hypothetical protein
VCVVQAAWALMRRKLARGSLPLLSVLQAKPLVVCVSHWSVQEYLAAQAICHGRWPTATPKPWAWSAEWRGVARYGGEDSATAAQFGGALLSACKASEMALEHVSGDAVAVAEAARTMMVHLATSGGSLVLRAAKRDVLSAARALPDTEKGELRMPEFGLGELPVAGFAALVHVLAADASVTALSMPKNRLTRDVADALVRGVGSAGSNIARLGVERNALGSEGASLLCAGLRESASTALVDLDLSNNGIGRSDDDRTSWRR